LRCIPAHVQVLQDDHRLGFRQLAGEVVQEVLPLAGDCVVKASTTQLRLLAVSGSTLLPRDLPVETTQLRQVLAQRPRWFNHAGRRAIRDHRRRLQAEVDTGDIARFHDRLRQDDLPFPLDRERDEPAIGPTADRRRENVAVEAASGAAFLQPDLPDHRQAKMPLAQFDLVESGRVSLALALELREAALRPLALQALEEPLEGGVEVDECLLADVRRDLVQPRALALLQSNELLL